MFFFHVNQPEVTDFNSNEVAALARGFRHHLEPLADGRQ